MEKEKVDNRIIEIDNLKKYYKISIKKKGFKNIFKNLLSPKVELKKAVDDINLNINRGEMVGLIGPNGAGKSTTIKMLCGILFPTGGSIRVNGLEPSH